MQFSDSLLANVKPPILTIQAIPTNLHLGLNFIKLHKLNSSIASTLALAGYHKPQTLIKL